MARMSALIFAAIRDIAKNGLTILLVEQNTRLALETAQRAYVLVSGEVALSGDAKAIEGKGYILQDTIIEVSL